MWDVDKETSYKIIYRYRDSDGGKIRLQALDTGSTLQLKHVRQRGPNLLPHLGVLGLTHLHKYHPAVELQYFRPRLRGIRDLIDNHLACVRCPWAQLTYRNYIIIGTVSPSCPSLGSA